MADIGEDGTTTVWKLEGFQISLQAKRSRFTASGVPSLDLFSITLVISNGPHRFPGREVNSLAYRLHAHTTDRPSHFLAPSRISIDHVGNTQRTGEYALEGREEAPTAKARRP